MVFHDPQKAYEWLIENPLKRLYIIDGDNYVLYDPYKCLIQYFYIINNTIKKNYIYDYRIINDEEEFIRIFKNIQLNTFLI